MTRSRRASRHGREPERQADVVPEPTPASRTDHDAEPEAGSAAEESHVIDFLADELGLARAQLDSGLGALAEGTVRRRLAHLEADGVRADDETDALRLLLAEALWRQGRPLAARASLEAIRSGSPQRRLPIALLLEAETLAAAGEADRAAGAQERLIAAIGVDEAFELLGGVSGRLTWPLPAALQPGPSEPRPPWSARPPMTAPDASGLPDGERLAAGRGRLEEARVAYVAGNLERGDAEMALAIRLDPGLAADGVALIEPTLGGQPSGERLLLYGDLLGAAGREAEATRAFDRAADRRSETTHT